MIANHELEPASLVSHEALTEEQIGNLFASVGNHEGKALLIGAMTPGLGYGITGLSNLFHGMQGDEIAHSLNVSTPMGYCKASFAPIGMVVRDKDAETKRFVLTEYGETYGKAMAGFMLDLSNDFPDISLRQLLGMTKTNGKDLVRPPYRRIQILEEMIINKTSTVASLGENLGLHTNTLDKQLKWMIDDGVIGGDIAQNKDLSELIEYFVPSQLEVNLDPKINVKTGSRPNRVNRALASVLSGNPQDRTLTFEQIVSMVSDNLQDDEALSGETRLVRSYIAQSLRALEKGEQILRTTGFTGYSRSDLAVTKNQQGAVDRLLFIKDLLLEDPETFIQEGKAMLEAISADKQTVRTLLTKAYANSPEANCVPQEERFRRIGQFISSLDEASAATKDVIAAMKEHGITKSSTVETLQKMRKAGLLKADKVGAENQWTAIVQ